MAKTMATFGSLVTHHKIKANPDSTPQAKSNLESFQYAFLVRKEAEKISSGENPDIKTGKVAHPTFLDVEAAKAIKGAIAHMSQVTRFGLVLALNIERI